MISLLKFFVLIPLAGFIISLVLPKDNEKLLSWTAFATVAINLLGFFAFLFLWLTNNAETLDVKNLVLYETTGFEFFVDFSFDKITAVFLFVGAFLTLLVAMYSRYYLHREDGYKRFFNTILFFYFGYNVAVLAGNLETLFIGWEILGVSSFLLISFYRDRFLPVKNAIKVFSIYRIGDLGFVLAIWMNHHFWHENITFLKLTDTALLQEHLQNHTSLAIFISLMILLAALVKSAQLPFSSWLPRAMEGPTPSSAIFYGSLSVHLGVFLLLRTFPFWESLTSVRALIIVIGLSTAIIASLISRVQSSVKSQIAYSSIAQIGLIFIEVALGFSNLALFHFAGNAFLRTYQLLVSPSVVSYLIKEQFYNFIPSRITIEDTWPKRMEYSIYILSLKEWNLDVLMTKFVFRPAKVISKWFSFLSLKMGIILFIPIYLMGIYGLNNSHLIPESLSHALPLILMVAGLLMGIKAFTERKSIVASWLLVVMNHLWIALSVSFNEPVNMEHTMVYLSAIVVSGIVGVVCLQSIKSSESNVDLSKYYGHVYEYPKLAFVFLLACLGLSCFPISSAFVGEDLMFSHIHENQMLLAFITALSFMIDALAIFRIYSRIFLGPHVKTYHEVAYKSS